MTVANIWLNGLSLTALDITGFDGDGKNKLFDISANVKQLQILLQCALLNSRVKLHKINMDGSSYGHSNYSYSLNHRSNSHGHSHSGSVNNISKGDDDYLPHGGTTSNNS